MFNFDLKKVLVVIIFVWFLIVVLTPLVRYYVLRFLFGC